MACIDDFAPLMELCEHQGGAVQDAALERAFAGSSIYEHARSKVEGENGTPLAALLLCGWDSHNQDLVHTALVDVVCERMGPDAKELATKLIAFVRASAMSIGYPQVLSLVGDDKERAASLWELFEERAHRDGVVFMSLALRLPPNTVLAWDAIALISQWTE